MLPGATGKFLYSEIRAPSIFRPFVRSFSIHFPFLRRKGKPARLKGLLARPQGQPAMRKSQLARPNGQPGLRVSQLGMRVSQPGPRASQPDPRARTEAQPARTEAQPTRPGQAGGPALRQDCGDSFWAELAGYLLGMAGRQAWWRYERMEA